MKYCFYLILFVGFFAPRDSAAHSTSAFAKYGSDGAYLTAIKADNAGNVVVVGGISGDFLIRKYDSDGELIWEDRCDVLGQMYPEIAFHLEFDQFGNIYVGGYVTITFHHACLVKYSSTGQRLWTTSGGGGPVANMVVDGSGNVYIVGASASGNGTVGTMAKFTSNGQLMWSNSRGEELHAIRIASNGEILVGGRGFNGWMVWAKYDPSGLALWWNYYPDNIATIKGLAIDSQGNIFMTGRMLISPSGRTFVMKVNPAGTLQWLAPYAGANNHGGDSIALFQDSELYVAGSGGDGMYSSTLEYRTDGTLLWADDIFYYGSPNFEKTIESFSDGSILVSGSVSTKYDTNGSKLFSVSSNRESGLSTVSGATEDTAGDVWTSGSDYPYSALVKYVKCIVPTTYDITIGRAMQSDLTDLIYTDDKQFILQTSNSVMRNSGIQISFTSSSQLQNPNSVTLNFESRIDSGSSREIVELFDFTQNEYIVVSDLKAPKWDSVRRIIINTPARFVQPGTMEIRARCTWPGTFRGERLIVRIDQFAMVVR